MTIIRVIDFETTGTEPPAQVCEVGICDLHLEAREVHRPYSWLCGVDDMPPEVRAVHHISKVECDGKARFAAGEMFGKAYGVPDAIAAHNADFETKFFPSPVPVGAKVRLGAKLLSVEDVAGGAQGTMELTFEVDGAPKPSCVAEVIFRYYV